MSRTSVKPWFSKTLFYICLDNHAQSTEPKRRILLKIKPGRSLQVGSFFMLRMSVVVSDLASINF